MLSLGWQDYFSFCIIAVWTNVYTFVKPLLVTWNHSTLARNGWNEQDCLGSHSLFRLISDITILCVFQIFFSKLTSASNFLIKMCYCDPRVYWTVKLNHISSFGTAKLPPPDFPETLLGEESEWINKQTHYRMLLREGCVQAWAQGGRGKRWVCGETSF